MEKGVTAITTIISQQTSALPEATDAATFIIKAGWAFGSILRFVMGGKNKCSMCFLLYFSKFLRFFSLGKKNTQVSFSFTSKLTEHHQTKLVKEPVRSCILIPFENVLISTEKNPFHL